MARPILLVALLLAAALAGCTTDDGDALILDEGPPPAPELPPWPELQDADIRPGIQVTTEGAGQCTANFLFRSADNRTLYLGVAAHCFGSDEPVPLGSAVSGVMDNGQQRRIGEVAYNAWMHTDQHYQLDFGLIELDDRRSIRAITHPAVMWYGGPVALAANDDTVAGDHVISYGHSSQRGPQDADNPRQGRVLQKEGNQIQVWTDHPGIKGDSGSGLMTADGRALGVLSTATVNFLEGTVENRDMPRVNTYVGLDEALDFAVETDPDLQGIELVTWELLQGPAFLP